MHYPVRTSHIVCLIGTLSVLLSGCLAVAAGGAAVGGDVAADRRTAGIYVEDENLELKILGRANNTLKNKIHLNVTSFNRNVLLTGEAEDASAKQKTEAIARGIPNVRNITNAMTLGPASALTSRADDSYITSKVKARLLSEKNIHANYVKVVTEQSVVYLMGIVTQAEATIATEIAQTTSGVRQVVRVFEYVAPQTLKPAPNSRPANIKGSDTP